VTTWYEKAFQAGSRIRGKWHGRVYTVERQLGAGANGMVVLVRRGNTQFALKAGYETVDHQSEINMLRILSLTETSFRNYLVDVDDFSFENKQIPFSVLRYIEGVKLTAFMQKHGPEWIYVVGTRLLKKLTELHKSGLVFGDLKLENMLVSGYGDVELIDFGGVTPKGQGIKQLTEVYDRGYWGAGSRVADESYDLFAFAVLILHALDDKDRLGTYQHSLPQNRSLDQLQAMIKEHPVSSSLAPFLNKALQGQISTSLEAFRMWKALVVQKRSRTLHPKQTSWLKVCFAASLLLFGTTVYLYWVH
jgi:serine/threonine protein kinase